jgi:hypothetical protein
MSLSLARADWIASISTVGFVPSGNACAIESSEP